MQRAVDITHYLSSELYKHQVTKPGIEKGSKAPRPEHQYRFTSNSLLRAYIVQDMRGKWCVDCARVYTLHKSLHAVESTSHNNIQPQYHSGSP